MVTDQRAQTSGITPELFGEVLKQDGIEKTQPVNYAGRGLTYDWEGRNRNIVVADRCDEAAGPRAWWQDAPQTVNAVKAANGGRPWRRLASTCTKWQRRSAF
jgi:hypothetical protein